MSSPQIGIAEKSLETSVYFPDINYKISEKSRLSEYYAEVANNLSTPPLINSLLSGKTLKAVTKLSRINAAFCSQVEMRTQFVVLARFTQPFLITDSAGGTFHNSIRGESKIF